MTDSPVAFITGGARRIGAAIAHNFQQAGCRVVIHYRSSDAEALALAESLGGHAVKADLTNQDDVEKLSAQAMACFGRVDYLINNASSYYRSPLAKSTQQQWDDLVDSNVRAAFFLSQALADEIKARNGSIVNIIDAMADRGMGEHSIYNIAKSGLAAMTKSLARELGPDIRVNAVSPGAILWPTELEDEEDPATEHLRKKVLDQIALGRLGTPEDIANAVRFLAMDARYMTGAIIKVDGGRALA